MGDLSVNPKTGELDMPKHFWAMVVFDYTDKKVKILEITQKGVQAYLTQLSRDEDWGDPVGTKGYDIVVTRDGEGFDTKYTTSPKPHKELDPGILKLYTDMKINLEALYTGGDPFAEAVKEEEVNMDEVAEALS